MHVKRHYGAWECRARSPGDDVFEAKAWAARRRKSAPEPTTLQLDFIRASEEEAEARLSDQRKQLDAMAAAQAEREKALHEAEEALNTDFDWLREHTRYLQRATEWDRGGRPVNRLLSGDDIAEAKAWVTRRPKNAPAPTALHLDFIRASEEEAEARSSAQRKQLEAVAAAQAEREKALHEAEEALKQAADAQRKRARIRNIALVVVSIFAVLAGWLYWNAEQQRKMAEEQRAVAEEQRAQADDILGGSTDIFARVFPQLDDDTKKKVFAVTQRGADHGDRTAMQNLGWLYENGQGVTPDYVKAREWYEKAADKGVAVAMDNLGLLYANGQGVTQDYVRACEWYEKSADKGEVEAMTNLGWLYQNGQGVPQDYGKAREWYEKAAAKDNAAAKAKLEKLTPQQRAAP